MAKDVNWFVQNLQCEMNAIMIDGISRRMELLQKYFVGVEIPEHMLIKLFQAETVESLAFVLCELILIKDGKDPCHLPYVQE